MKSTLYILIFGFVILSGYMFLIFEHESAHKEIYRHYDIKADITIDYLYAYTTPEEPCPNDSCILANNLNEVVGYHMLPIYSLLALGLLTILF